MECYLDNSATTRCLDSAAALMAGILCTDYGNPSSLHHKGVQAEEYVRHAREVIAKTLKVTPKEIFFTSGGTESDNLALRGAAYANARQGKHLITTSIEHPAILNTMQYLEQQGCRSMKTEKSVCPIWKRRSVRIRFWFRSCTRIMRSEPLSRSQRRAS